MDPIQKRFDELETAAQEIIDGKCEKSRQVRKRGFYRLNQDPEYYTEKVEVIDAQSIVQWTTSVQSLLVRVFGPDDPTYENFSTRARKTSVHPISRFEGLRSVFLSAKDQYEGGHLFDVRNLVHADVIADELEQAKHFLHKGFKVPAAVIAGTVLETTLREMCSQHPSLTPADNINKMNDDLAREGVFNNARKQQITAWAAIRNNAAHGKPDEFEPNEVSRMIDGIQGFVGNQMS